jgi:nicotinamide phosphoribosyltransferase
VKILMGDPQADVGIVRQGLIPYLLADWGDGEQTSKGYQLLPPCLGTIYGDAMTPERCDELNSVMLASHICPTNAVRGIGSYTYEYLTRDSLGQKLAATQAVVEGDVRDIFKDPITSDGEKKSYKGRVGLIYDDSGAIVGARGELGPTEPHGFDWTPLEDGIFAPIDESFADVRKRTGVW